MIPAARLVYNALAQQNWPRARNLLTSITNPDDHAFCLSVVAEVPVVQDWIGEWVAAEPFEVLGDLATRSPWSYLGDSGSMFSQHRSYAGIRT
ncbi:hypothetical protein ACWDV4_04495 [Micromonospora sp. NPDC003197]